MQNLSANLPYAHIFRGHLVCRDREHTYASAKTGKNGFCNFSSARRLSCAFATARGRGPETPRETNRSSILLAYILLAPHITHTHTPTRKPSAFLTRITHAQAKAIHIRATEFADSPSKLRARCIGRRYLVSYLTKYSYILELYTVVTLCVCGRKAQKCVEFEWRVAYLLNSSIAAPRMMYSIASAVLCCRVGAVSAGGGADGV